MSSLLGYHIIILDRLEHDYQNDFTKIHLAHCMKLDLSSFEKAIISLKKAILDHDKLPEDEYIRDACIQRFEYTYELSWKMLKRYLEMTEPTPEEIDALSFASLIRTGSEKGLLLSDFSVWRQYREKRSITSHTYNQEKAAEILKQIPSFLKDAQYLLDKLHERAFEHEFEA